MPDSQVTGSWNPQTEGGGETEWSRPGLPTAAGGDEPQCALEGKAGGGPTQTGVTPG